MSKKSNKTDDIQLSKPEKRPESDYVGDDLAVKQVVRIPELDVSVRVSIRSKGSRLRGSFTDGAGWLLEGIQKYGSLKKAAENIEISYGRAWAILNETQKNLGFALYEHGETSGSVLTTEGANLLRIYQKVMEVSLQAAQKTFKQLTGPYR